MDHEFPGISLTGNFLNEILEEYLAFLNQWPSDANRKIFEMLEEIPKTITEETFKASLKKEAELRSKLLNGRSRN